MSRFPELFAAAAGGEHVLVPVCPDHDDDMEYVSGEEEPVFACGTSGCRNRVRMRMQVGAQEQPAEPQDQVEEDAG